jgi:hypothetical protein
MPANKKFIYDKLVLSLLSVMVFLALVTVLSILLRLGSGQGISEYYTEYRQGPHHSVRGDFSPTGSVWGMLQFVWFTVVVVVASAVLSYKSYAIKRQIPIIILSLGVLLVVLTFIVSNVLLGHR